jgi:hypothetical protein
MILLHLLDHDLHRSRKTSAAPLMLETPAKPGFVPAIISGSGMDIEDRCFLIARKLTKENKIRSGVFRYDSDKIDDVIGHLMVAALGLSEIEKWPNIFPGKQIKPAFDYVQKAGGLKSQPHLCLIPEGRTLTSYDKTAGKEFEKDIYRKMCRVMPCKVSFPVFCSRPDFVGMYTQFMGGHSSILLHNIKNSLSFCPPDKYWHFVNRILSA